MTQFIVAEVSKNWHRERPPKTGAILSHLFEGVIEHNQARGYRLYQFAFHQVMIGPDELTETIIAAFQKTEEAA